MSTFKDSCNRWLTSGLFYEARPDSDLEFAKFTLQEEDRLVQDVLLISIKKCYMSCTDPTEYEFANKFLGGWSHWKAIQASGPLKEHIITWRDELEVKLRAEAIKQIALLATTEKGYQAAKFIADRGWKTRIAGAPSKDEIEGMKAQEKAVNKEFGADAARLGLTLIK